MAIQFFKLKVKDIIRETNDAVSISFDIPIELKKNFEYKHGQYLTLRFFINGNDERRAYSASSSPIADNDIYVTVKCVEDGKVSKYINNDLKIGDIVDVMPPLGNFTIELNKENSKNYFFFAGGSGITPIISIIKSILATEPNSKVNLIYANRKKDSIIFYNKLQELNQKYPNQIFVNHILSKDDKSIDCEFGKINSDYVINKVKSLNINIDSNTHFFLCGPSGFMQEVENGLSSLNIPKSNLHKESFTVESKNTVKQILTDYREEITTQNISVAIYGSEYNIKVEPDESILVAAMRASLDPPFSCQIGACSTCRAKLISGSVYMEDYDALTEDEINEGYILTCTSHPTSENVAIDYDN